MYKYLYVESKAGGLLSEDNHREIIDKYAAEGWRFVAAIPKKSGSYGQITANDLVFEMCEEQWQLEEESMIGKKWRRILIFSIIMCLNACGNTLCTKDEMLQAMKNEQNISGEIVECGSIVLDDKVLCVGANVSGGKVFDYCAAQFVEKQEGQYQYENKVSVLYEENQSGICKWQDGYVIICTIEKSKIVRVVILAKNQNIDCKVSVVDIVPFVYYMDMSEYAGGYDVDYRFLDQDGVDL